MIAHTWRAYRGSRGWYPGIVAAGGGHRRPRLYNHYINPDALLLTREQARYEVAALNRFSHRYIAEHEGVPAAAHHAAETWASEWGRRAWSLAGAGAEVSGDAADTALWWLIGRLAEAGCRGPFTRRDGFVGWAGGHIQLTLQ